MKKYLKFLNVFIIFSIIFLIGNVISTIKSIFNSFNYQDYSLLIDQFNLSLEWDNLSVILFVIFRVLSSLLLVYLFFVFRKVVVKFSKNKYFISKNIKQLYTIAIGLTVYGLFIFILKIISVYISPLESSPFANGYAFGYAIGVSLGKSIHIFISSALIFLLIMILEKGNVLKEELDLTI